MSRIRQPEIARRVCPLRSARAPKAGRVPARIGSADGSRLRVGTIRRVADGYAYSAPRRARAVSPLRTPSVRYRLCANDVARYVIPPHGVRARRDRRDEAPSSKEMQIVDDLDPRPRPVYQLTPSLTVARYQRGGPAIAIANPSDRGTSRVADAGAMQRESPSAK